MLLFIQQNLQAASGTTGSIATTLAGATGSLTGVETFSGTVSTTLTGATASVTGQETFSGSIATTLSGATVALAGSETYSGNVSTTLTGASASLTGSVSGGAVSGVIGTTLDGASASLTGDNGQTGGGGYDDTPKKKRFIVERDGKLLVFSNATDAMAQMEDKKPHVPIKKQKKKVRVQPAEVQPEITISLPQVQEYAQVSGLIEQYNAAYNSQHFEALIALFEQMRDEEEVEMLLLGMI